MLIREHHFLCRWDETSFGVSCNFADCLRIRETGDSRRFQTMRLSPEYGTRHMLANGMLRERPLPLPGVNKVSGKPTFSE